MTGVSGPLRILVVSDAWTPQVNGVVRTMATVVEELQRLGDVVEVIGPDRFRTVPTPGYAEIRLAIAPKRRLARLVDDFRPQAVHIATEGPLGWAMRSICKARGWRFTTSFHTKFPDYVHARTRTPKAWSWALMRHFHAAGQGTLCATPTLAAELSARGFTHVVPWSRGVDLERFHPDAAHRGEAEAWEDLPRPIFLVAGRVAVEKNLEAFLALDLPGSKVVVGDGPQRAALMRRFPEAHFTGWRENGALARAYARADVFVFPSRTDTFGLVLLESLASGTPVAAFPVTGPLDVIADHPVGALDADLRAACLAALQADRATCRAHAQKFSWAACALRFRDSLLPGPAAPG
ncbi:glycosyltransferase family 4 protein [Falsiroseomonas tokyonensis]|uniref:Glycosyltransferase family 4 protein n=1 Tax=Falsiroseomonas tokyonensis TaxID=430521 RepID=A0ABV7BZ43_9PROT|nr:glycosyltransferase family 1 protein [Falsiroseomonas tokyonensis]MBU8539327.1 glycosyltransferase family 1 protein [Falsiroseomonas tokyonensis]